MDFFKKKKKATSLETKVRDNIYNDIDVENAVITYILLQSQTDSISLGKKNKTTYIHFKNEKINNFLNEWYTIIKLRQDNKLSEKMYEVFISTSLNENKVKTEAEKDEDEFSDY